MRGVRAAVLGGLGLCVLVAALNGQPTTSDSEVATLDEAVALCRGSIDHVREDCADCVAANEEWIQRVIEAHGECEADGRGFCLSRAERALARCAQPPYHYFYPRLPLDRAAFESLSERGSICPGVRGLLTWGSRDPEMSLVLQVRLPENAFEGEVGPEVAVGEGVELEIRTGRRLQSGCDLAPPRSSSPYEDFVAERWRGLAGRVRWSLFELPCRDSTRQGVRVRLDSLRVESEDGESRELGSLSLSAYPPFAC